MEINVPIIIGSLPQRKLRFLDAKPKLNYRQTVHHNAFTKAALEVAFFNQSGESTNLLKERTSIVLFMPNRKEVKKKYFIN